MGFDIAAVYDALTHSPLVVRVVVAQTRGSTPRDIGAAMLVWDGGQAGTIGGGTLEFEAVQAARTQTATRILTTHALGPDLGQCCGGSVTLLSEIYTAATLPTADNDLFIRPIANITQAPPQSVQKIVQSAQHNRQPLKTQLKDGWMIEPIEHPTQSLWVWGAGHVGRALIDVLAPLPQFDLTWIDTAPNRFPSQPAPQVTILPAQKPSSVVRHAPSDAAHIIVTYSHQLDLELCDSILRHGFHFTGVIGSNTKWARFRKRLAELGHTNVQIDRINCPIGEKTLGKHPQAIAVGVASQLLQHGACAQSNYDLMTAALV